MTAFANSHPRVLRQCNAAIISAVRIYGNLLSQNVRRLFLFLYIENFNFRYHSAFLWINYFSYSQILIELFFLSGSYHLYGATTPRRRFTAFGRWRARPSRLWGSGTDEVIPAEVMNQKATPAKEQIKQIYCLEKIYATFTELSEASVNFVHASCGCGASV